ncbi:MULTISPECIES: MSMEG_0568 family radical SAM protein [unclassified Streptomyces]|uniref:MSMEG_0568 family radical SAM protein n=1 Tax=unclassified Streptomyces TaxID=2593676 RepID=UPI0022571C08|nr:MULTISPECIES: MSMEG_0568 family radical SAM protein [unclassified Streptomyces]MCX5328436.1 MSMEG_0568 family radical SAM protein [Streptomyces sp. NBC_00140]MCX5357851.1 MSMEG_0568 family radical SAM protein [Streptomyces sp. NBC_00124]
MSVGTNTAVDVRIMTRAELALHGVRSEAAVRRPDGAGPSDDGHVLVDGANAALPTNPDSPYSVRDGKVWLGEDTGTLIDTGLTLTAVHRPKFYDLTTADGTSYEHIARLHGADVLATTVVQTCIRYAEADRCRFCTIEESLRSGATVAAKTPAQLAEVTEAAVRLDGITQMVMTTGTTTGPDRGARNLVRSVRAVLEAVPGLPIQVQCEPPGDLAWIRALHEAGATAIGIHVESLDDEVRRRWMPGKSSVPMAEYEAAWDEAVRVFGPNRVSTYLLVGLGEGPDELIAGAGELIDRGVYPFVVPFRPMSGTLAAQDGIKAPSAELLRYVTEGVAGKLRAAGMSGADQKAGCAACGACSVLKTAGG